MKNYVSTSLEQFLNESKTVQLKRQYKDVPSTIVNTNAPIRNQVIGYVNENVKVSKDKLKKFIASINESNVPNASIMWLKRNSTFFLKENRKGVDFIKLSPLGKKLVEKMNCEINEGCNCGKKKPPIKRSQRINEDEYNINLNIANKEIVKDEIPEPSFTPMITGIDYEGAPEAITSDIEGYDEEDFNVSEPEEQEELEQTSLENKEIDDVEELEADELNNNKDDIDSDVENIAKDEEDIDDEIAAEVSDDEVDMENMNADVTEDDDEEFADLNSDDEEVENAEIDDEIEYDPEIDEIESDNDEVENIEENEKMAKRPTDETRAYDFKDKGKPGLLDEELPDDKIKDGVLEEDEDIKLTESKKEKVMSLIAKVRRTMLLEAETAKEAIAPDETDELNSDDLDADVDTTEEDTTDDDTTEEDTTDDEDEKVEITEFVLSVEDVEESLKELEELGINAEKVPTGEDDENGEALYEPDQIKVSADQWSELKGWLEEKGVDITELFGGEVEVEGENEEADDIDFNDIDFELEDTDDEEEEGESTEKPSKENTDLEKSEIPKKKSKDLNESAEPLNEFLGAAAALVAGVFVGYKGLKALWNNRNSLYKSIISTGVSSSQMKKIDQMVADIKKNTIDTITDNVKTYIANTKDMRQRRAKRLKQNINIDALDSALEKESKKLMTGIGEVLLAKAKVSMNELYASLAASKRLSEDQKNKIKQYWDLKMKIVNSDIANQLAEQKLLFVHEASKASVEREDAKVKAQKPTNQQGTGQNQNTNQNQNVNPAVNAGTI